jgi:hypothetical protein
MILIVATAIAIGLFFLLRNINLWYFRINEGIERMDKQIELLEQIKNHLANGQTPVKADNANKVSGSKVVTAKVENYTKSNNIYSLINGDKYEVVKDGDFFYFEYSDKKYYYANINAAENSLNDIAIAKDPSKKDLVSVKNK